MEYLTSIIWYLLLLAPIVVFGWPDLRELTVRHEYDKIEKIGEQLAKVYDLDIAYGDLRISLEGKFRDKSIKVSLRAYLPESKSKKAISEAKIEFQHQCESQLTSGWISTWTPYYESGGYDAPLIFPPVDFASENGTQKFMTKSREQAIVAEFKQVLMNWRHEDDFLKFDSKGFSISRSISNGVQVLAIICDGLRFKDQLEDICNRLKSEINNS
jgi:hypothetical protein